MKLNLFGYSINIDKLSLKDDIPLELKQAIAVIEKYGIKHGSSQAQKESAKNATSVRQAKAKEKILAAIAHIQENKLKMTSSQVSKTSGCSINTVRKYKDIIEEYK